jgi:glycerol kinase
MRPILALDQGTSSSRAILFDEAGAVLSVAQTPFAQRYPADGWVEHDALEIWETTLRMAREALAKAGVRAQDLLALGITNQRETTVLWDRRTGVPVAPAIVWQDRRTAGRCEALKAAGLEPLFTAETGLCLDPYFSGTKLAWLLAQDPALGRRAEAGELAFGTIDSWLIYKLTEGQVHATDATNASRTLLWNIHEGAWSEALCEQLAIPQALLPEVRDSAGFFGEATAACLGAPVPIFGVAGDQQAALFGQACLEAGDAKSTFGTGCFAMSHCGAEARASQHRLLTTVAVQLQGVRHYALEGSIFIAGAAVQWLRDQLGVIASAGETADILARTGGNSGGVYLVPAFAGLGAPHWDPQARGLVTGMTLATGRDQLVTATVASVAYQMRDLLDAMSEDGARPARLRIDGGMVVNDAFCQLLADVLELPVERPQLAELTAAGAAGLAALGAGAYAGPEQVRAQWRLDRAFEPQRSRDAIGAELAGWRRAVALAKGG